jgi:3-hydroxyacyl-[acyl-carrier-protein] dehydratase
MKFRLVDRILQWEPRRSIAGVKAGSFEEYCLKEPWAGPAALPESLIMESLFQLGNWLIILSSDFTRMGLLVRLEEVRFRAPLLPGQCLRMDVEVTRYRDDGVLFNGIATCAADGQVIAAGRGCLASPAPLAGFHNQDALRVLYSEIHRPLGKGRV